MKLIYGRSGTGKSEYVYKDIKKKLEENCGKIYIITPEQFSFTAEKRLLETIDDGATLQVEVLSFARMAHRVISETMTLDKDTIDKAGKAIIIYETIEKNKKKLRFLGNSLDNVDTIITQITEFKKHNISVEMLEKQVEKTQDQYLKAKLNEFNHALKSDIPGKKLQQNAKNRKQNNNKNVHLVLISFVFFSFVVILGYERENY